MNFNIIGRRKVWYVFSSLIVLAGLISFAINGLNLGIDFKGGTLLDLKAEKEISVQQVRQDVLKPLGLEKSDIRLVGEDQKEVIIRTRTLSDQDRGKVLENFGKAFGKYDVLRIEKVEAVIAKELIVQAIIALAIAAVLMIIYITFRFEFKFAITGIIALLHDVFVVLGVFSLLQVEIDSSFVAAILTIVGYSINDTIVIFDRIRENLGKGTKKIGIGELVNDSLMQTMSRSINTSLTTLITIVALFLFGGETIKGFSLALIVGIISGTYSSLFIASPLWVSWKIREKRV
jgi:preprotein translocase subunit SecF